MHNKLDRFLIAMSSFTDNSRLRLRDQENKNAIITTLILCIVMLVVSISLGFYNFHKTTQQEKHIHPMHSKTLNSK